MKKSIVINGRNKSECEILSNIITEKHNSVVKIKYSEDFNNSIIFNDSIPYDCECIIIDEVPKNESFQQYYNKVTDGFIIEHRGKDKIKISPKFIFLVKGALCSDFFGQSFFRRFQLINLR